MINYYEILEIKPTAKKEEIKAAFRQMARRFHPDVNHTYEAELKFKQVNLAAKTLLDDKLRSQYDFAYGYNQKDQKKAAHAAAEARETYKKAANEYKRAAEQKKSDFAKTFGEFFTKKEEKHTKKEPNLKKIHGEDITTEVAISQNEAFSGTSRKVNILESEKCPKCFGAKFINGAKCTFCDGLGEKTSYKKICVKIPPNVKEGTKIRVKGQGNLGTNGGDNGDLYLIIHIEKETFFKVKDGVVYLDVPITPYEAILGASIKVPTPCGVRILQIPPMTTTNTTFKLLECGVINNQTNKRGEQIVNVVIDINKVLSDKEIKLYYELQNISDNEIRKELFRAYEQKNRADSY